MHQHDSKWMILIGLLGISLAGAGCQPQPTAEPPASSPSPVTQPTSPDTSFIGGGKTVASQAPSPVPQPTSPQAASPSPDPQPSPSTDPQPSPQALDAGTYCYQYKDENLSASAKLTIAADSQVTGQRIGSIHNENAGYFAAYDQAISGTLKGKTATVSLITQIDGDTQNSTETWQLTAQTLTDDQHTYQTTDCAAIDKTLGESSPDPVTPPPEAQDRQTRVQFEPGTNATVIEEAVVRGTRDTYLLRASAGQTMTLNITSLENNAVFDLIGPDGSTLAAEGTETTTELPLDGDYKVVVGGTRGNATYKLSIQID